MNGGGTSTDGRSATGWTGHGLGKERPGRRYDFGRLKRAVTIGQVLAYYGLGEDLRHARGELTGPCPLPGHQGDRNNRSAFCVNLDKAIWRCFSSCGGGDIVDLVRHAEGADFAQAARVLALLADGASAATWSARAAVSDRPAEHAAAFAPYTRTLRLDAHHPFLRTKGIRPDTARTFEVGAWPYRGFLERCIGIRLHDAGGNPLGYAGRRLDPSEADALGKWKLPPRFPKTAVLFNHHRAHHHFDRGVIIVEGPFDAMRVHQAGYPNVVALLGTDLTTTQIALLRPAPRVTLVLDGDPPGRTAARRAMHALTPTPVDTIELPDGADPADVTDQELRHLITPALSQPVPPSARR